MSISDHYLDMSYSRHPDSHSSSSNMAVSFLAAGANDVLVNEAEACPLVKFEALSGKTTSSDDLQRFQASMCSLPQRTIVKGGTDKLSEPLV
jgi:hypothetical protein